jgi:hypothetical protein
MEINKNVSDVSKLSEVSKLLDKNYSGMHDEIEKLRIEMKSSSTKKELATIKAAFESKLTQASSATDSYDKVKKENERLLELIEKIFSMSKENKARLDSKGIAKAALSSDDDDRVESLLKVIDSLASQVSQIKKRIGIKISTPKAVKVAAVVASANEGGEILLGDAKELSDIFEHIYSVKVEFEKIFNDNGKDIDKLYEKKLKEKKLTKKDKEYSGVLENCQKLLVEVRGILESLYVKLYEQADAAHKEKLVLISQHFQEGLADSPNLTKQKKIIDDLIEGLHNFKVGSDFPFASLV